MEATDTLEITFTHSAGGGSKVFFQTDRGIRLFRGSGSFTLNLLRSILMLSGLLAILAAIGVSTGAMFSLPVACYSASLVLILQAFSGVISEVVAGGIPVPSEETLWVVQRLTELRYGVFQALLWILQPMQVESPLGRVADGVSIPTPELVSVLGLRFLPVIALAAVMGIWVFSKREAGDAS
jgi:hypothetical protein